MKALRFQDGSNDTEITWQHQAGARKYKDPSVCIEIDCSAAAILPRLSPLCKVLKRLQR